MSITEAYESGGAFGDVADSGRRHQFTSVAACEPYRLLPGLLARAVHGERTTLAVVDMEPGLRMSPHRHHNEQIGVVVRGEMLFTVGGEPQRRVAGDMWVIPAGVPHEVLAGPDGCTVVECFTPARDDWDGLPRTEPAAGAWPTGTDR
jgi:quercetin dioxygenase-like cupin family protein